jgi:hypothetical protein
MKTLKKMIMKKLSKIGFDRVLHFCATIAIALIVAVLCTIFTKDAVTCASVAWCVSWLCGVAKEISDKNGDSGDLIADFFGSVVGALSVAWLMLCGYAGLN